MRTLFKLIVAIVTAVGVGAVLAHLRPKVPRAALNIAADEATRCEAPKLPTYEQRQYQRRVAANDYLAYAVASLNAYTDGSPKGVTLDKHSPEFKRVGVWDKEGLAFRVYHREDPGRLTVLTVMRGTEGLDKADWLANLSWLVAWLPIETRYDEARLVFQATRKQAYAAANGRKVSFIMAGHSLGGGIAQHIALSYPCTAAAVFNTSAVTNKFRLAEPYDPLVVHTFEDKDELTNIQRLLLPREDSPSYKAYRQDAVNDKQEFQHSITGLTVGMARQVLRCQERRAECPVPAADQRAKNLYCKSWGVGSQLCRSVGG